MAQSGYTPIKLYYSSTTTNVPSAGNLAAGELAINITDGKLFYKDNAGAVQVIASKASTSNVSSFSGGTTGLTPSTATTGVVTLAGTLAVANGGTGVTTSTGSGANVLGTSPTISSPTLTGSTTVEGLTLGQGGGAVSTNTAFGYSALNTNSSGTSNTTIGYLAGVQILTGSSNTAIGMQAVASATTTSGNTGVGYVALTNTTGTNNTAVGYNAGSSITSGSNNVVVGSYSGSASPIAQTGSNWVVLSDGSGVARQATDSAGNTQFLGGGIAVYSPTPASFSGNATLTNANIQTQIIVGTTGGITLTMPLGTTLETLISWSSTNLGYDFSFINTGGTNSSLVGNTGVTFVGSSATTGSARFRIRRTAANTFVVYRLS